MPNYIKHTGPSDVEAWTRSSQYEADWDDLRFPATAVNPPGQAADPDFDTTNGTWLFDAAGTETIFLIAQMPHAWKEGSTIKPHVHWYKSTSAAGNVMWQLDYKKFPIGEVGDAAFTTLTATTTVSGTPDNDTAQEHLLTSFADIDMTGLTLSDMLLMKVSRIGGNAADTYGADCSLLEFDIHLQLDTMGSERLYIK